MIGRRGGRRRRHRESTTRSSRAALEQFRGTSSRPRPPTPQEIDGVAATRRTPNDPVHPGGPVTVSHLSLALVASGLARIMSGVGWFYVRSLRTTWAGASAAGTHRTLRGTGRPSKKGGRHSRGGEAEGTVPPVALPPTHSGPSPRWADRGGRAREPRNELSGDCRSRRHVSIVPSHRIRALGLFARPIVRRDAEMRMAVLASVSSGVKMSQWVVDSAGGASVRRGSIPAWRGLLPRSRSFQVSSTTKTAFWCGGGRYGLVRRGGSSGFTKTGI